MNNTIKSALWLSCVLLLSLIPGISLAETTPLNFTPQPSDMSMVYLGNIFGVVDGVLYGGGSQILGEMFAVINSAILTLGGMTLIYIVIVGTLNTSADGQFLGKNWDSIWTPVRSVLGFSGLFVYPSGYSTTQICIMWTITQGIGMANLTWNAALNYLQMGGTIVQVTAPTNSSVAADSFDIISGTSKALAGTTCMVALQTQLETLRAEYLALEANSTGPCASSSSPSDDMKKLCDNAVPNFIDSGDITDRQNAATSSPVTLPMPYFPPGNAYEGLNGICGQLSWNLMDEDAISDADDDLDLSDSEEAEMNNARATAVQQVYADVSIVANDIADNDVTLSGLSDTCLESGATCYFTSTYYSATSPLGIPSENSSDISTCSWKDHTCLYWISPDSSYAATQSGIELQSAVSAYNTIIEPTLNAIANSGVMDDASAFIEDAQADGWMSAGAYFYNLIALNEISAMTVIYDKDSGFANSTYPGNLTDTFCQNTSGATGSSNILCTWYSGTNPDNKTTYARQIVRLMQGPVNDSNSLTVPTPNYPLTGATAPWPAIQTSELATTAYGYISNAANVTIPGQTAIESVTQTITVPPAPVFNIPHINDVGCGSSSSNSYYVKKGAKLICEKVLNNGMIKLANSLLEDAGQMFGDAYTYLVSYPLTEIAKTFETAKAILDNKSSSNPIIILSDMGNEFINAASTIWFTMGTVIPILGMTPAAGSSLMILVTMMFPLIFAWLTVLWAIGIMGAYIIPMTPFAIFTMAAFGWFVGVLETMVAAPIIAFGIIIPEGHPVFGKSVDSLMMGFSIFIRPMLIIMGLFAAIILSTEGMRLVNYGFVYYLTQMQRVITPTLWTEIFAYFFYFTFYMTLCNGIVTKSCSLIYAFADSITLYLGGGLQQSFGSGTAAEIGGQIQSQGKEGGEATKGGLQEVRTKPGKKKESDGGGGSGKSGKGGDNQQLHVGG